MGNIMPILCVLKIKLSTFAKGLITFSEDNK